MNDVRMVEMSSVPVEVRLIQCSISTNVVIATVLGVPSCRKGISAVQ
jgi:hypothetical protein